MLKIAITGGIAAGKTLASKTLESLGAYIIDADIVSREVTASTEGKKRIMQAFGEEFFDANGELDRRKFREYVFADKERVKLLNSLIHPLIKQSIIDKLNSLQDLPVVFVVIPLLIEIGMVEVFDRIWTISSEPETRIKRLIRRDNISEQQAYNILSNQASEKEREKIADVIIRNDGGEQEFVEQIKTHYRNLLRELGLT
ncbi:MAG TPA: dephospho-CoA kinase [Clostridia bacterium]